MSSKKEQFGSREDIVMHRYAIDTERAVVSSQTSVLMIIFSKIVEGDSICARSRTLAYNEENS